MGDFEDCVRDRFHDLNSEDDVIEDYSDDASAPSAGESHSDDSDMETDSPLSPAGSPPLSNSDSDEVDDFPVKPSTSKSPNPGAASSKQCD
mmetsp:Transcript_99246/g.137913  ORF Transcript_99246/g.137913 Transcript_99246/m.137913 type:complete len:91 (+) Transcript_99246:106-378(+)